MSITTDPPIQLMPGDGFTTRIYAYGNEMQRRLVRKHLRRRYAEGVQMAYQYFEYAKTRQDGLRRLWRMLNEED